MEKATRRRYTLEYKQEAVRLVLSGQKVSAAAKALGIVEQPLANWVKADKAGDPRGVRRGARSLWLAPRVAAAKQNGFRVGARRTNTECRSAM